MRRKGKVYIAKNARELAELLNLPPEIGIEWEVRSTLLKKIIEAVNRQGLSHQEVAKKAKTSRTRITAILNNNIHNVSTDLLLRILGALGYRVNLTVSKQRAAA